MLPSTSFFIVQLSSMITGWCAIAALAGPLPKGTSVFSAVLLKVAAEGTGQAVLAALLLASGGWLFLGWLFLAFGRHWGASGCNQLHHHMNHCVCCVFSGLLASHTLGLQADISRTCCFKP